MNEHPLSPPEVAETLWQYFAGPLPSPPGSDDLQALADQFIQLKQHLGHRYHASGECVRAFLRFLDGLGVRRAADLSAEPMLAWAASRAQVQPLTWMREVSAVSVFLDHLKALGTIPNNLCALLRRRTSSDFRPYIFGPEELKCIFAPVETRDPAGDRALVYYVIYACGLRAGEAAHLRMRNLDLDQGTIFIESGKFGKDRRLPLHRRVVERIKSYRDHSRGGAGPDAPLFPNPEGRAQRPKGLSALFHRDLSRHGLYHPTREVQAVRYGSPRLHSLRHSFAVHRLLRWYREGADVQAKLPLLSTYLGHSDISHTQVYLKVTGLLLREGHARFAGRWEREFPIEP